MSPLDAGEHHRFAETTEIVEIVEKVERSLASLDAGRGVPHAEVLAMIDGRYPGSK